MSSYYTTAELEARRKERLRQELAESIQKLKEQLRAEHVNTVQMVYGSNIKLSVFAKDDAVSGYRENVVISGAMLQSDEKQSSSKRMELDFSELLESSRRRRSRVEKELDFWLQKVEERPIISEKDEEARTRLLAVLAQNVNNEKMDIEDKMEVVKMRVSAYLEEAEKVSPADAEQMKSAYFEYCALCEMLEEKPIECLPERVKKEVERMNSILEKRMQDRYVGDVIESIMRELGCHVKDAAVLDDISGQMYAIDGHPLCDVFIGSAGGGIMFEPVGSSKEGSLEKRRQLESSANSICSLYSILEERAAAKGVILKRSIQRPVDIDKMYMQSDIRSDVNKTSSRKDQRKMAVPKQRTLDLEG